jgi:hypothetical protein
MSAATGSHPSFSDYTRSPSADIDLEVVDANGVVVATSASYGNTSEIVEFDSWWGGTFTVRAVNYRCDKPTSSDGPGNVVMLTLEPR